MREDLIKILANIGDDYAGTIQKLEAYVVSKQEQAIRDYVYNETWGHTKTNH